MSNGLKLAVIIFLLTIVVVVINPKTHKGIEISSSSSSNVVLKTDDNYIKNQDIKLSNKDSFKNTQTHKFSNIDGLKDTDTNLKNVDNINNNEIVITDKDVVDYEQRLITEYRRRKALATKPINYDFKNSETVELSQPQIVLDPNYKKTKKDVENIQTNIEPTEEVVEKEILEEEPKEVVNNENDITSKSKNKKLKTRYEETIVWNSWKSNLFNKIHDEVAYMIPDNMPLGALYKYSFIIDKYGNVSDINVKVLFPGISLDGDGENALKAGTIAFHKAIRKCAKIHFKGFPKGSQRNSVKLELVVQMGFVNVYTKPEDFNDSEKVFGFR